MKTSKKELAVKLLLVTVGLSFAGLGTAFMYQADLGSSPMATMADGLHVIFGITYGTGSLLANAVCILPVIFMARELIGPGTVLCVCTLGWHINFWKDVIGFVPWGSDIKIRIFLSLAGILCMSFGLSLYVVVRMGLGAVEAITEVVKSRFKTSYRAAKIMEDIVFFSIGVLMGGTFGIGTVLFILISGFLMQYFQKTLRTKQHFLNQYISKT